MDEVLGESKSVKVSAYRVYVDMLCEGTRMLQQA